MAAPTVWRPLVLLVDDDVRSGRTLARMLQEDGYDVDFAVDGAAAISRLTRNPLPEVLVTDLTMPFADGLAVTRYERSRRASLAVFVVTGHPLLAIQAAESIVPPPIVLTKPLDYESFSAQLRSAVGGMVSKP